ncbi:MAG: glycosyltransferase family 4 protein [Bacteroidetes bacterium]|jgi:glycosyltransferase involved in cell wall biosynthesis|nr:glycosyltransferase family 4 protein [Bacteroidota bacterium]MBT4401466.1 glycosyltransferase family 4 protein [Bacteroidota bacterium]MBT4408578.1 glycosyltransferase family 4 protein [Bacteroidota bacterium]MBT7094953.1 glycosyltransferase family 4 protein [Bacteroidota bacterium]MBT7462854.1 glycosyltransferase family 4 protein [Bacteroidota bacterium]
MRVLMFGWEFPPHISGGLGTACYGLTKGLAFQDVEVIFVVPKAYGDEDQSAIKLIGASGVPVMQRTVQFYKNLTEESLPRTELTSKEITYLEVGSMLMPYLSPEEFETFVNEKIEAKDYKWEKLLRKSQESKAVESKQIGTIDFSGKYGPDLLQEVSNYGLIAAEIAQGQDFDLIHAHDWLTYAAGIAAQKISGKPLIIHVHATEYDRAGENVNSLVFDIERMGMEAADRIITVSNLTRNTVVNKYGIPEEKVFTVYNAVEPNAKIEEDSIRKHLNEKVVTFLGRVTFQKGPEYFIEAAYKVLQKTDDVRFVMAGNGDLLRKMIRHAARLGITKKFHFTDFLKGKDVDRMFQLSDVYVMPSVSEPFGISPLEAMRSNVPVIISKQSGVSEILKYAIKIDFWDVDAMADAIYGLVKYSALSDMFSKHGKTEVDNLKWENAAKNTKEQYTALLENIKPQ